MKELILVIPVYNEQANIENCLTSWTAVLDPMGIDYEIVMYNDGSKDQSLGLLKAWSERHPRVRYVDKPNAGHGPTILQAYRENCPRAQWIFQADGDNEIDPEEFPKLWAQRFQADYIQGIRRQRIQHWQRRLLSLGAKCAISLLFSGRLHDVNIPFRLMKSAKIKSFVEEIPPTTFAPNILLSGLAAKGRELVVQEVDVPFSPRQAGVESLPSGIKIFKLGWRVFRQTFDFFVHRAA